MKVTINFVVDSGLEKSMPASPKLLFRATQTSLRGTLKDLTTTLYEKLYRGTRLIIGSNGKKVKYDTCNKI
mgnify:FL=1